MGIEEEKNIPELKLVVPAEKEQTRDIIMTVDEQAYLDFQHLQGILRSPNMATAIYNAVLLILDFYEHEDKGYKIYLLPPYTRELTGVKMPRGKRR